MFSERGKEGKRQRVSLCGRWDGGRVVFSGVAGGPGESGLSQGGLHEYRNALDERILRSRPYSTAYSLV